MFGNLGSMVKLRWDSSRLRYLHGIKAPLFHDLHGIKALLFHACVLLALPNALSAWSMWPWCLPHSAKIELFNMP